MIQQKNLKLTKQDHAFKAYPNTCNVEIFKYFNPELLLKDAESAIKSKLIKLLT